MNRRQSSATTRALHWLVLLAALGGASRASAQFGFDAFADSPWRRLPQQSVATELRRLPPTKTEYEERQVGMWTSQDELNTATRPLPPIEPPENLPAPRIEEFSDGGASPFLAAPPLGGFPPPAGVRAGQLRRSPRNYTPLVGTIPEGAQWYASPLAAFDWYHLGILGRGYYINDQRIEWSGVEATFGAEGILAGGVRRTTGLIESGAEIELFLNQPFDRNILFDSVERRSYLGNWEVETLELSQLYLMGRHDDWMAAIGKMPTPFGRTYFPLYLNDRSDAPFIRTESILWRETALLFQFDPDNWIFTAALMNGGEDRDANSSKGLVARVAYESSLFAVGGSIKVQDGIGSEGQKQFNEHVGVDLMVRGGRFVLSGEAIYDQYGLRRPFNPLDITWGRSLYFRDQNIGLGVPITGFGYYANLGYEGDRWTAMLNYGEYFPQQIGDPRHDVTTRRGIAKIIRHFPNVDFYLMTLIENDLARAQDNRLRRGTSILSGFQLAL